jgi:hypothetical protein
VRALEFAAVMDELPAAGAAAWPEAARGMAAAKAAAITPVRICCSFMGWIGWSWEVMKWGAGQFSIPRKLPVGLTRK